MCSWSTEFLERLFFQHTIEGWACFFSGSEKLKGTHSLRPPSGKHRPRLMKRQKTQQSQPFVFPPWPSLCLVTAVTFLSGFSHKGLSGHKERNECRSWAFAHSTFSSVSFQYQKCIWNWIRFVNSYVPLSLIQIEKNKTICDKICNSNQTIPLWKYRLLWAEEDRQGRQEGGLTFTFGENSVLGVHETSYRILSTL